MLARLLPVLLVALTSSSAAAHDPVTHSPDFWINNSGYKSPTGEHCCGENDCISLTEGEVQRVEGGYEILTTEEFIPDAEVQVGEDSYFWRCKRWDGSRRCFFTPAGGT